MLLTIDFIFYLFGNEENENMRIRRAYSLNPKYSDIAINFHSRFKLQEYVVCIDPVLLNLSEGLEVARKRYLHFSFYLNSNGSLFTGYLCKVRGPPKPLLGFSSRSLLRSAITKILHALRYCTTTKSIVSEKSDQKEQSQLCSGISLYLMESI